MDVTTARRAFFSRPLLEGTEGFPYLVRRECSIAACWWRRWRRWRARRWSASRRATRVRRRRSSSAACASSQWEERIPHRDHWRCALASSHDLRSGATARGGRGTPLLSDQGILALFGAAELPRACGVRQAAHEQRPWDVHLKIFRLHVELYCIRFCTAGDMHTRTVTPTHRGHRV